MQPGAQSVVALLLSLLACIKLSKLFLLSTLLLILLIRLNICIIDSSGANPEFMCERLIIVCFGT